ncbi:YeiH family protein [Streptococcus acidominimus]|uniref:Putative sulfate exporter family transporter n=1 Tax=Streptococcus acidominimus TaxID=1326 RepID=A0A4Y9FR64_STRAI|nr:putative sulfate exporter family transporter [Streptococcus acidominimus]MBF0818611.1 putative sulfate exporter family transporter [Streptococcus acidominimus]MBF0838921.1 putative sulfate exporter family transporter [Streptococcus acidominimus]MBF0847132.1 putative sulfate exporter family transporter [Streptococcus danieliae]TFU30993.1 putative sulfate exporter family transporter [Streptococcus acidominimus]
MKLFNREILPGFFLSFLVAFIAKRVAVFLPSIGAASLSICIGIILGNTVCRSQRLEKGTKFSESRLLEISVALLGLTVTFQTIGVLGLSGLFYIVFMMTSVILFTYFLGQRLGFKDEMSLMIAGGNAVCGSSAIGAIAPAIKADSRDKGQAIVLINLLGTILMFVLPVVGVQILGFSDLANSALTGGVLQSVGQVVASASLINTQVTQYATLFKITRILFLVVVVFAFERLVVKKKQDFTTENNSAKSIFHNIPWYILAFLLLCFLNSALSLPHSFSLVSKFFSSWFEMIALAAIGLRLDFKKFLQEGPKFLIYMGFIGLFQLAIALLLIFAFRIG